MGCDRAGCIGGFGCATFAVSALLIFSIILVHAEHWLTAENAGTLLIIPIGAGAITLINVKLFVWLWDRDNARAKEESEWRDLE